MNDDVRLDEPRGQELRIETADRRNRRRFVRVLLALVLLEFGCIAARFARWGLLPPGFDRALIELRVRDVGHTSVLTGPYSRFGWFHPGPMLFYLLAVPYRLLGAHFLDLQLGSLLIGAACVFGIGLVALRRGWPVLVFALLCTALLLQTMANQIGDLWNPSVVILPALLLILLAWTAALGDATALPWMVLVASFMIQTHVGTALLALSMIGWGTAALLARHWHARRSAGDRGEATRTQRAVAFAGALGVLLWLPPLYDEMFTHDKNLSHIWHFFMLTHQTAGFAKAARVVGAELDWHADWIFGSRSGPVSFFAPTTWPRPSIAVLVLLTIAGAAIALHRRRSTTDPDERRRLEEVLFLAATVAIATVAALFAVSQIVGDVTEFLVEWTWAVGAAAGMTVLLIAWMAVPVKVRKSLVPIGAIVATTAIVSLSATTTFSARPANSWSVPGWMASATIAALPPGKAPVKVDISEGSWWSAGLILDLERSGIRTKVVGTLAWEYGASRSAGVGHVKAVVRIVVANLNDIPRPRAGEVLAARQSVPGNVGVPASELMIFVARQI